MKYFTSILHQSEKQNIGTREQQVPEPMMASWAETCIVVLREESNTLKCEY
jgi:hypothetical protein